MAYHYHYDNTIDSLSLKLPIGTGRLIHNHRNLAVKLIELWFCHYQYELLCIIMFIAIIVTVRLGIAKSDEDLSFSLTVKLKVNFRVTF